MTTPTTNDVMAVERLRTLLTDAIDKPGIDAPRHHAEDALTVLSTAAFERTVNEAGVPMRRVVAYGEWEMDPNPPKHEKQDIPTFAEGPTPHCTKDHLHKLWGQIYTVTRGDWLSEQADNAERVRRLRAAIYDVVHEFGAESPQHLRLLYVMAGTYGTPPTQEALNAVDEADADRTELDGETELRQKLTALAFYATCTLSNAEPWPLGRLIMRLHDTLSGTHDPREKVKSLHTLEPGHVGTDGKMIPLYTGPRRDDEVAAWLKRKRDEYTPGEPGYFTLDSLLNDYRLHADTGASLSTPTEELGPDARDDA